MLGANLGLILYGEVSVMFFISCISIEKHRVALSRFRCSAHKLMIEEERYRNIERNNRLCQYCQMNVI